MSTERIIVPTSILPAFSTALRTAINEIFPSPATLITPASVKRNKGLVDDALSKGASLLPSSGSNDIGSASKEQSESASSMTPTVIQNVTPTMQIYHTESFGPTVSLIALPNPSPSVFEDTAISLANDTHYGLAAAIFTSNLFHGLRVAKKLESGAVHINSMTIHDEAGLPHGGVKESGWGRFNSGVGIGEFLKGKTVTWVD